jgi:hypothetical protein
MRFQLFQAPANMNLEFSNRAPDARLDLKGLKLLVQTNLVFEKKYYY